MSHLTCMQQDQEEAKKKQKKTGRNRRRQEEKEDVRGAGEDRRRRQKTEDRRQKTEDRRDATHLPTHHMELTFLVPLESAQQPTEIPLNCHKKTAHTHTARTCTQNTLKGEQQPSLLPPSSPTHHTPFAPLLVCEYALLLSRQLYDHTNKQKTQTLLGPRLAPLKYNNEQSKRGPKQHNIPSQGGPRQASQP